MGTPAKVVRTYNSFVANKLNAMLYYRNALCYARGEPPRLGRARVRGADGRLEGEIEREFAASTARNGRRRQRYPRESR
jgi:hypothetical protein